MWIRTSSSANLCLMICVLAIVFSSFLAASGDQEPPWRPFCHMFRVHVIDGFSSNDQPLLLHCWSKDQDLGNHTLYIGGDFNFRFGSRVVAPYTRFTCEMHWGQKHQTVTVFNKRSVENWCCNSGQCYWRGQDDGIYYSSDNSSYQKKYDWLQ
ncbi:hypothetical protein Tsubulata_027133 [Turnera subulata]|uniref:S-protein homolog n=1 Tax=Turnera subulata TaxID=218843 RepID=A0A9Q0GHX5_9ROSI|nr:hypothetical protein Tsubulata_027133 [Turnera subulata]